MRKEWPEGMPAARRIWLEWYAWYPVLPQDDTLFWLENVYRRKKSDDAWEYRSFRTDSERCAEHVRSPVVPGA